MSESPQNDVESEDRAPSADEELTGDEALDARLAAPVLTGTGGLDVAQVIASGFIIAVVTALAYSNSFDTPFNSLERDGIVLVDGLHRIATAPAGWARSGMNPVGAVSLAADWSISDGSALYLRIMNALIHAFSGILVFLIARKLVGDQTSQLVAATAGLIFVLHPAATATVNLLTERGTLVGTSCFLLATFFFLSAAGTKGTPHTRSFGASLLFFALAFAAWPGAWIAPIVVGVIDFSKPRTLPLRERLKLHAPVWIVTLGLVVAYYASGGLDLARVPGPLSLRGLGDYLAAVVYPGALSVAHGTESGFAGLAALGVMTILSAVAALRFGGFAIAVFWFFAAILGSVMIGVPGAAVRETVLYAALPGLAFLAPLVVGAMSTPRGRAIAAAAVGLVAIASGGFTFSRNTLWQDETVLWQDARGKCPTCDEPLDQLSAIYIDQVEAALRASAAAGAVGDATEAARQQDLSRSFVRRADTILTEWVTRPDAHEKAWVRLGTVQRYQGNIDGARATLRRAIEANPQSQAATLQLAMITEADAMNTGDTATLQRALELYGRATELGAVPAEILERYAGLWYTVGDSQRALGILGDVGSNGSRPMAEALLTQAQQILGQQRTLATRAAELARTSPNSAEVPRVAARQYFLQGKYLHASYLIETIFRNQSKDLDLWYLLGACKAKMGGFEQFLSEWPEPPMAATPIDPWRGLARMMATQGDWAAARLAAAQGQNDVLAAEPIEYGLAEIALEIENAQQAVNLLNQAAEARPSDPEPWLRLCEIAIQLDQPATVKRFLGEAKTRGASDAILAEIRERAGVEESRPTRTLIR